jgi:hypothetical protein
MGEGADTPHIFEFAVIWTLPSPARGEGAITRSAPAEQVVTQLDKPEFGRGGIKPSDAMPTSADTRTTADGELNKQYQQLVCIIGYNEFALATYWPLPGQQKYAHRRPRPHGSVRLLG